MATSYWLTAKCTNAPRLNVSSGSGFFVTGSMGRRVDLYCLIARSAACLNSDFNSSVATGTPLTKSTRSMRHAFAFTPVAVSSASVAHGL